MQAQSNRYVTPEEYIARERVAEHKSEYNAGRVEALAGASRPHNQIVTNLITVLSTRAKACGCDVYGSDLRVKVGAVGKYTYPDLTIACGEQQFEDSEQDTLLNPAMVVEVLSDSTEAYDRGAKFEHYKQLASLREYLLIDQRRPRVERFVRTADGWLRSEYTNFGDLIPVDAVGMMIAVLEIYDRVDLAR